MYRHVRLAKEELQKLRAEIKPLLGLKNLQPRYDLAEGTRLPAYTQFAGSPEATLPPDALLKVHKFLTTLDFPKSTEWVPEYVEVMLWDYSYAPESSIVWPKDWPSLESDRTTRRGQSFDPSSTPVTTFDCAYLDGFLDRRMPR